MSTSIKCCLVALALVFAWAIRPPTVMGAAAGSGIATTAHDFTSAGPSTTFQGPAGTTICETCHVPHHAGVQQLIWNQTLPATDTFGTASTVGGTTLPTNIATWTGSTRNCLSCHDGTVAVGSGWSTPGTNKITGARLIGDGSGNLGTAGQSNHPVAIPYPGESAAYNSITSGYSALPASWNATTALTGVKLYTDPSTAAKGMECGSCHDPHNKDAADVHFLRVLEANICSSCHPK